MPLPRRTKDDLYKYQSQAIIWLDTRPKAFLALEQGLGKTACAIYDMVLPAVIVCPATLRFNWRNEILIWHGGLKEEHIDIIESGAEEIVGSWVTIISYELFAKRALEIIQICQPKTIIFDESHYLKTGTTNRTKAAKLAIKHIPRVRLLSGTPILNRPMEFYPMLQAIGAIKMDWRNYAIRYCAAWDAPWGFDTSGASNLDELYNKLAPVMFRRTKKQVLPELPDKIYRVIEFLDDKPNKRELELRQELIEKPEYSVDFQAIADIAKMNAKRKVKPALNYIRDVLETQHKVIVFAWHKEIVADIEAGLKKYNPVSITGMTAPAQREHAVEHFQEDDTCRVFIGNIKAAGVGLTLTAASHVIFVESTWTPADIEQASDRAHRIGQKDNVVVDLLVYNQSIDSLMIHKIINKVKVITKVVK